MVKYLQSKSEHHAIRQEGSARDFSSRQGLETQEGFVPFKFPNRGIGGKDPARLADGLRGAGSYIALTEKSTLPELIREFPSPAASGNEAWFEKVRS